MTSLTVSALVALVVSAGVTAAIQFVFADRLAERNADRSFRYERRKQIRTVLSEYDGRLIEAASDLHARLRNMRSTSTDPTWLASETNASRGYFYRSTVYRFLALFRVVRALQERAIFFERSLTPEEDRCFLQYAKALELAMTDVRLFDGTGYDVSHAVDHFFLDQLRSLCTIELPDDEILTFDYFQEHIAVGGKQDELLTFFAGLGRSTTPLRWDRMMTTELVSMAFLDSVGFIEFHRSSLSDFGNTVAALSTERVRHNLPSWIDGLDLPRDSGMAKLRAALA